MEKTVWTIGHSTRDLQVFIKMLKSFHIEKLVDVRSYPGSRKFPQFNKEAMEISIPKEQIEYEHMRDLGGRRRTSKDSKNSNWRLASFRGYADYMEKDEFKAAIGELESIASTKRVAYMCAEAVWWSCHRSMISDYLKANGWKVMHIMDFDKAEVHPYTQPARLIDGKLTYHQEGVQAKLFEKNQI